MIACNLGGTCDSRRYGWTSVSSSELTDLLNRYTGPGQEWVCVYTPDTIGM